MRYGFCFVLLSVLAMGCDEKQDPVSAANGRDTDDASVSDGPITYTEHIKPILDRSCVGCHSSELQGKDRKGATLGVDFDTYQASKDSASAASARIQSGSMPPAGPLAGAEKTLFEDWIDDGLVE